MYVCYCVTDIVCVCVCVSYSVTNGGLRPLGQKKNQNDLPLSASRSPFLCALGVQRHDVPPKQVMDDIIIHLISTHHFPVKHACLGSMAP